MASEESLYRDLVIVNELGLHARSAAKLAKTAQMAHKGVWLKRGNDCADAKQVIDILTLAAVKGDCVRVEIETPDDRETLDRIVELFAGGFGE
ncbi:MAG: HPr family phosphocarrier protein [Desulfobacteraceae bacterium]|nr:MAG: HPr family phosphocarrier protein [Desulfobacteraceae bacterium]